MDRRIKQLTYSHTITSYIVHADKTKRPTDATSCFKQPPFHSLLNPLKEVTACICQSRLAEGNETGNKREVGGNLLACGWLAQKQPRSSRGELAAVNGACFCAASSRLVARPAILGLSFIPGCVCVGGHGGQERGLLLCHCFLAWCL